MNGGICELGATGLLYMFVVHSRSPIILDILVYGIGVSLDSKTVTISRQSIEIKGSRYIDDPARAALNYGQI